MKNFILKKIKVRILIIFLIIIFSIISFFKIKIDSKRWINANVTIKLPFEIDILSTGKSDFILIECENKYLTDCSPLISFKRRSTICSIICNNFDLRFVFCIRKYD